MYAREKLNCTSEENIRTSTSGYFARMKAPEYFVSGKACHFNGFIRDSLKCSY